MNDLAENQKFCPCSSNALYADCCRPLHEGLSPPNALALMRSRYSAYALGNYKYIINTTHPGSPLFQFERAKWEQEILKFSNETAFNHLEIIDFTEGKPFSSVTFAAHLSKGKRRASFTEKSYFEYFNGRWLYRNGLTEPGIYRDLDGPSPLDLLPIAYIGDDVLLQKALPVEEITEEIKELVYKMVETMDALDGIGIAAPQVHSSLRLFVIREPVDDTQEDLELGECKIFINPRLDLPSVERLIDYEACLSIPGIESEVERPVNITVFYTDLEGNPKEEKAAGLYARALMHEMDHLEGTLFYTHLSLEQQEKMNPFLESIKARFQQANTP